MKRSVINYCTLQPQRIICVLVLTGILSLSTGLTLLQAAIAASSNMGKVALGEIVSKGKLTSDRNRDTQRKRGCKDEQDQELERNRDSVVPSVANALLEDLSSKVKIPAKKLKIIKYSRETWTDNCLGLGTLVEQCLQTQVEGWRVTLSDGSFSWVYRTDLQGRVFRLENQIATNLPPAVADGVLQAASKQSRLPIADLRIVEVKKRSWPDSCLGLASPGVLCATVVIDGWLVTVEAGQQRFVYRTNADSSQIKLETASTIKQVSIPTSQLPPLQEDVIFRAIASGGFAGRTYETNLFEDGRVIRVLVKPNGTTSKFQVKQISKQQVKQFKQLLKQEEFEQFNNLSYPAPSGAADYITYTLTSQDHNTIRYTDINQNRLPSSLQTVIQAWNQLIVVE